MDWHVPELIACHGQSRYSRGCFQWTLLLEIQIISLARWWCTYGIVMALYYVRFNANQQRVDEN